MRQLHPDESSAGAALPLLVPPGLPLLVPPVLPLEPPLVPLAPLLLAPPLLEEALALDQPSIIAVPVDYGENVRLTEALGDVQITV